MGWRSEWAATLVSVLIGGAGLGVVLFRVKRRCVFDRQLGIVAVEHLLLVGTRARTVSLDTVAKVLLLRHESEDAFWCEILLVLRDGGTANIGTCSDASDGWGAENSLKRAIRSFGLEVPDDPIKTAALRGLARAEPGTAPAPSGM